MEKGSRPRTEPMLEAEEREGDGVSSRCKLPSHWEVPPVPAQMLHSLASESSCVACWPCVPGQVVAPLHALVSLSAKSKQ